MTSIMDRWKLWKIRFNQIKSHKVFEISIITIIVISAIAVGARSYPLTPATLQTLAIIDYEARNGTQKKGLIDFVTKNLL